MSLQIYMHSEINGNDPQLLDSVGCPTEDHSIYCIVFLQSHLIDNGIIIKTN